MRYPVAALSMVMVSGTAMAGFESMMNPMAMMNPMTMMMPMTMMAAPMGMGMMNPMGMGAPVMGMGAMYPAMQVAPNMMSFGHMNQMGNPYLGGPLQGNPYFRGGMPMASPGFGYVPAMPTPAMPVNPFLQANPAQPAAAQVPSAPTVMPFDPAAWMTLFNLSPPKPAAK